MYIKQNAGTDATTTGTLPKLIIKTNAKNYPNRFFIKNELNGKFKLPHREVSTR
jgi:hypothetical protein